MPLSAALSNRDRPLRDRSATDRAFCGGAIGSLLVC
jgi:hypothetical protein